MTPSSPNDPIRQFAREVDARVAAQASDPVLRDLAARWTEASMARQYVYNFSWLGRPIIQFPEDIVGIQELVWKVRPDVIVETGIAHGGSLILSASLLAMLDLADAARDGTVVDPHKPRRRVVGVDIDIRAHNRRAIEEHPLSAAITMIQGSSIDPATVAQVRAAVGNAPRVLVFLDSMHTHAHVLAELEAYAPLVTPGSYCVVLDTFVEDLPPGFFKDRPWDRGDNPKTAVHAFLKGANGSAFEIDPAPTNKLLVTVAPDGYLHRRA